MTSTQEAKTIVRQLVEHVDEAQLKLLTASPRAIARPDGLLRHRPDAGAMLLDMTNDAPPDAPIRHVIVPLDGSERAESALAPALALARHARVPVTLYRWESDPAQIRGAELDLDGLVEMQADEVNIETVVTDPAHGSVADSLVAEASARHALICMASHGRSRVGKMVLGSVTTEVVRQSAEPVLVVGPKYRPEPTFEGRRLVVCIDGSDFSELVVPIGVSWAQALGMALWLVESVAPDAESALARAPGQDILESSYVGRIAHTLRVEVNWDVLHAEHPADAIISFTQTWPAGLLVMATHGRSGWSRARFGSVAMQVLQGATCPVLLVHPRGGDSEDDAG